MEARAFLELFADIGAKKRGPELAGSLIRLSRPRSWSRYLVLSTLGENCPLSPKNLQKVTSFLTDPRRTLRGLQPLGTVFDGRIFGRLRVFYILSSFLYNCKSLCCRLAEAISTQPIMVATARPWEAEVPDTRPTRGPSGGHPMLVLPLARSWSQFVGIYCQKLTTSLRK